MAATSGFESRSASLSCTGETFYRFITDIRNFGRIIPPDVIKNWQADENSCSFVVSGLGDLKLKVDEKVPHTLVKFGGNALMTIDFVLSVLISGEGSEMANVQLVMEAELNPIMKMMASGPIRNFLETLVKEMENFKDWEAADQK